MPLSMTGFGHYEMSNNGIIIRIDIKSLNGRFLDVNFKSPKLFSEFEIKVSGLVKEYLHRGRITINLDFEIDQENDNGIILDENLLSQFISTASRANIILGKTKLPELDFFLNQPDVLKKDFKIDKEEIEKIIKKTLIFALQETQKMRKIEGKNLTIDLKKRLSGISNSINKINSLSEKNRSNLIERYRNKIKLLINNTEIDDIRLNQEIAILIERRDISEEIVRFCSHSELFNSYLLKKNTQVGKKMNFILQEMGREINTIGSKTDLTEISHIVIDMKDDLEKMREQVQNIL